MSQGKRYKGEYPPKETLYRLYYLENKSMGEMGEIFDVSRVAVRYWLKKNGVRVKNQSESLSGRSRPWSAANGSKSCRLRNVIDNPSKKPEIKKLRSQQQRDYMKKEWREHPEKYSNAMENFIGGWKNPDVKARRLAAKIPVQKISKAENKVAQILLNVFPDMKHGSSEGVVIGGKIPDFIDFENKIIIEVFGEWYHDKSINPSVDQKRTDKYTIAHYAKYGFKVLIIWSKEIKSDHWEQKLIDTIWSLRLSNIMFKNSLNGRVS